MKIELNEISKTVENRNADEFCVEENCSRVYDKYYELKIGKKTFFLPVCLDHDEYVVSVIDNE